MRFGIKNLYLKCTRAPSVTASRATFLPEEGFFVRFSLTKSCRGRRNDAPLLIKARLLAVGTADRLLAVGTADFFIFATCFDRCCVILVI